MAITAAMVKELREMTGAGMMDCKKALTETDGDTEKAIDILRKKGLSAAQKRSGRTTDQGIVNAYIHPGSKLGVLVSLCCETDFVARTEDFQSLVRELAMHIAAADPIAISKDSISEDAIERERQIYLEQVKESGKPEKIWDRIVDGRMVKFFKESCLLEQLYVKDTSKTVQQLIDEYRAKLGENIVVSDFSRFKIGK